MSAHQTRRSQCHSQCPFRKLPPPIRWERGMGEGIGKSVDNSASPHPRPLSRERARGAFGRDSQCALSLCGS